MSNMQMLVVKSTVPHNRLKAALPRLTQPIAAHAQHRCAGLCGTNTTNTVHH